MCTQDFTGSTPASEATVSIHPHMVRLDLTTTQGDGTLSVAHVKLTPAQALRLAYQLNHAHIVAQQITTEETP